MHTWSKWSVHVWPHRRGEVQVGKWQPLQLDLRTLRRYRPGEMWARTWQIPVCLAARQRNVHCIDSEDISKILIHTMWRMTYELTETYVHMMRTPGKPILAKYKVLLSTTLWASSRSSQWVKDISQVQLLGLKVQLTSHLAQSTRTLSLSFARHSVYYGQTKLMKYLLCAYTQTWFCVTWLNPCRVALRMS